jgi:hypothetical protein
LPATGESQRQRDAGHGHGNAVRRPRSREYPLSSHLAPDPHPEL